MTGQVKMQSLTDIQTRASTAAQKAGRTPEDITLIAVSKQQPLERVEAALTAGHKTFGENRVQEAAGKWAGFRERTPDIEVHLIGPLQTNKMNAALDLFDVIHTLDREKLARKLADAGEARGTLPPLFVQINTGEEPQKAGIAPVDADAFIRTCRETYGLPIVGLMAIPPFSENPGPHFALLKQIAARNGLGKLSMGMSGDFETAILFGATHIRIGSALFGAR